MPIITSIKPQRNKRRVNVYIDEVFGFGIDLDNLVLSGIKINKEFSDEEIQKIIKKAEFQKTYDKFLKFATLRPRSEKELRDWLKRKKVHESLHKDLFNRLKHLDLINDLGFAKWWVEQRQTFRPKSKRILNNELRIKGIKKEIIGKVLEEEKIDEVKIAKQLLEKKAYKWRGLEPHKAKQKMSQYLAGKGFSWEIISKIFKDLSLND